MGGGGGGEKRFVSTPFLVSVFWGRGLGCTAVETQLVS